MEVDDPIKRRCGIADLARGVGRVSRLEGEMIRGHRNTVKRERSIAGSLIKGPLRLISR
jgi:hypothetical protein